MSRYAPINRAASPPDSPAASPTRASYSRRSSLSSLRRPSFSLLRRQSSAVALPDPGEMEASFAFSDDDEEESSRGERRGLMGDATRPGIIGSRDSDAAAAEIKGVFSDPLRERNGNELVAYDMNGNMVETRDPSVPGSYDFEREYPTTNFIPPSASPPPFQPNSRWNPAQGNSNGIIPSSAPAIPSRRSRFGLLGSLLPSYFNQGGASTRNVGGGATGVFANLAARPEAGRRAPAPGEAEGPEWVPEESQKDGPPSYNAALRDAVPPYWETTVVLPSSTSPFGTLTSSMTGDEILIDSMPVGNFFAFAWNMLVSVSFQFIGFLLTYVLHTSHAAKHGSRAGLGITLIQYGLYLRGRAEEMIETGRFPSDPSDPRPTNGTMISGDNDISNFWGEGWKSIEHKSPVDGVDVPAFSSYTEAMEWAQSHNRTSLNMDMGLPTAAEVGQANEWLSFVLMAMGWFLLLTSIGGFWRVKRFERGLRRSQMEANDNDPTSELGNPTAPPAEALSPRTAAFYTSAARQAVSAVSDLRRNVRREILTRLGRGRAAVAGATNDDHELLFASEMEVNGRDVGEYPGVVPGSRHDPDRGLWRGLDQPMINGR